jgi:signal transduction histidine kinase
MADLRDLVLQLDRAESRERMQLAETIHDAPLQLVVAAMLRMDNMRDHLPLQERELIDDIAGSLEVAVEQLRALIVNLTPPDLSAGLGPALKGLAESTFVGSATQVRILGPDHVRLDPNTKVSVYRILREGLINARKHARAAQVRIDIVETADTVVIRLTDDGVGMATRVIGSGHLGVASMRARAAAADADLLITSPPTGGTTIELILQAHTASGTDSGTDVEGHSTDGARV